MTEIIDANGDRIDPVSADANTLITYFSTSCVYCMASIPAYRKLAQERCDLTMVFAVADLGGEDLISWWAANAWSLESSEICARVTIGRLPDGLVGAGVNATPTHVLVSPERRVVHSEVGALMGVPDWLTDSSGGR